MTDLAVDNSIVAPADNQGASEPAITTNGTDQKGIGQVPGATPDSDVFKGIDPQKLPPEVKPLYENMLRDYRDKTAKLSETTKSEVEKATQAYREKASLYDQIATQEEFVKQWNDYVQKVQSQTGENPQPGDPVVAKLQAQLQEVTEKIQMSEISQIRDAFADAVDEKGQKIRPDFDALNSVMLGKMQVGNNTDEYSLLRGCIELSNGATPQERLDQGYKTAKAVYDSIFEAGKKAGLGRLNQKVLNSTLPPSHSSGDIMTMTDKKPKNAREALAMAKRGEVVSRE